MIQVSPDLGAAIHSPSNQPLDLYELYLDSGTLYYADQVIAWGGRQYQAAVESRSAIRRYDGSQFDRVSVTFSNVNLGMAATLLTNEIEGRRLIIRKIDRSVAWDSVVLFNGEMERPSSIGEKTCAIEAKQIVGSVEHEAPARTFSTYCPFEPGQWECGQPAGIPCDKSWSRCVELNNSDQYGGFRFVPHSGSYQYQEITKERFLLLFSRKKKKTITASFNAVDDTPYDVPIPLCYGRVQIAAIDIQHEDQGGVTKALAAFCAGKVQDIFYLRANQTAVVDYTLHHGHLGALNQTDPRFPHSYPYNLVAYAGVTIPSSVTATDPAPEITAVVMGKGVSIFGPGGEFLGWRWSDNPIWCVRDFMAIPLTQGGMGIPDDWFDDVVNCQEAAYCDEIVTDHTNCQKIYNPPDVPEDVDYKRYRSTSVDGLDPALDGPYYDYAPGVDDDTSRVPVPVQVKRFTMNVTIAKQEKAIDILYKKLLASFRGYLTFSKEGKIQIRCERPVPNSTLLGSIGAGSYAAACKSAIQCAPGDMVLLSPFTASAEALVVSQSVGTSLQFTAPTQYAHAAGDQVMKIAMAFDDSNVIGSLEYPLSDRQPSTNKITIRYVDAPAGFESRELEVNDYEHQAKIHRTENEDVDGSAIDSYFQAWRIGQWRRAKARDLGRFCSFRGDIKATLLEIGDVIAVSGTECGLQCVPFRVIELSYEENDEVSILGQLYSLGIYDDVAPQTTVTVPVIFNLPTIPGQEIPGDLRPIGDLPFLVVQSEDGLNAIFDIEYDPPSPVGVFTGVTAHWVPDGAPKPAAAMDFDYLGDRAAADEARHGKCRFVVPEPPDADAPGRLYLTKRSKSYKETLVLHGNEGASPSVEVTIPKAGTGSAPNVKDTTTARAWYKTTSAGRVFGFEGVVVPPDNSANFGGCEIYLHWIEGWDGETPIYDQRYLGIERTGPEGGAWHANEPGFELRDNYTQQVDVVFVSKNRFGIEGPRNTAFIVRVTVTSEAADTPTISGTARVWTRGTPPDRVFGFEGTVSDGAAIYLHWIEGWAGDRPIHDPRYLEVWIAEPGGGSWTTDVAGWRMAGNWSQQCDIVFKPRSGDGVIDEDPAHWYIVRQTVESESGAAPNVKNTSTAAVWYKTVVGKRLFGFEGTVVPPDLATNFGGCEIYLHWIEGWDGETPIYDQRYLAIERTGPEGGAWHANEPGFDLRPNWSQQVDVVFVPKNRFGIEGSRNTAFTVRVTVTSEAADTPTISGTARVWTRGETPDRVFGFAGTVSGPAKIDLHWIEGWNGDSPVFDPRYLEVWDTVINNGLVWTSDNAGWGLEKQRSQQCDVVFKPLVEGDVDQDPAHWYVVRLKVAGGAGDGGGGSVAPLFIDEVPKGVIDGVNREFFLSNTPSPQNWCQLSLNGGKQHPGRQITIAGNIITYAVAPLPGDDHYAWYVVGQGVSARNLGQARHFAGGTDGIDYGCDPAFHILGDLSIGVWIRLAEDSSGTILQYGRNSYQPSENHNYRLGLSGPSGSRNIQYSHDHDVNEWIDTTHDFPAALPNGLWRYVGISRDDTAQTLALCIGDGSVIQLIDTWTYPNSPTDGNAATCHLTVGHVLPGLAYVGDIAEHYIWGGRALSLDEHSAAMTGNPERAGLIFAVQMGSTPERDYISGRSGAVTGTTLIDGHI